MGNLMPANYVVYLPGRMSLVNRFFSCTSEELPRELATEVRYKGPLTQLRFKPVEVCHRRLPNEELLRLYQERL